jgi:hypothetical protein
MSDQPIKNLNESDIESVTGAGAGFRTAIHNGRSAAKAKSGVLWENGASTLVRKCKAFGYGVKTGARSLQRGWNKRVSPEQMRSNM